MNNFYSTFFAGLILLGTQAFAQAESSLIDNLSGEEKIILEEYKAHFPLLKDFYSNLEMEADFYPKNNSGFSSIRYRIYLHDTGYARLDIFMEFEHDGEKKQSHMVMLSTPNHGYVFQKSQPNDNYVLIRKHDSGDMLYTIHETAPFATIPFAKSGVAYDKIIYNFEEKKHDANISIGKPNFTIKSVTVQSDEDSLVNIFIESIDFPSAFKELSFLQNRLWALTKSSEPYWTSTQPGILDPTPGRKDIRVEYGENNPDGIPLMKSVTFTNADPAGHVSESRYEITKIIPGKPDMNIFDPKQFLPPNTEPGNDIQPNHFSFGRLMFMTSGVFLVALGIWMKMKKQNN